MKCNECGKEVFDNSIFCPFCGTLIKKDTFKNEKLVKEYEGKMKNIISIMNQENHQLISWDSTVDKYVKTLEKIKRLLTQSDYDFCKESNFENKIDSFVNRCKSPEFHIAFVGTIKAGKSTLINALLGKNYASTSVTPETAVLTKFRHCKSGNYVKVKFYSNAEWDKLWKSISNNADVFITEYKALNGDAEKSKWLEHEDYKIEVSDETIEEEIERWTSSKKAEHYFVKEVEIGLEKFDMPEQVVFVDTPGLDDAVKYRSDVTRSYIDRANAVFACVKSDSLTGPELNTLYRIFSNTSYNPGKVYVIGTQWDSLNNPARDWQKQKAEWVKYLSRNDAFGSRELAEKNIEYVAAYVNNLARDYSKLDENEKWSLESIGFKFRIRPNELEANLYKLIEISNIDKIKDRVNNDIVSKFNEYLYQDIEQSYLDIKKDIKNYFQEVKNAQQEIIETSSKDIGEIREKYEKAQNEIKEINGYKEQLNKMLKLVKDDTNKRIKELTEQLANMVG